MTAPATAFWRVAGMTYLQVRAVSLNTLEVQKRRSKSLLFRMGVRGSPIADRFNRLIICG